MIGFALAEFGTISMESLDSATSMESDDSITVPICYGVEYNNNCYGDSFTIKNEETFYTQKEIIYVEKIMGSICVVKENGLTMCTNTLSSVDLKINYKCTGNVCPSYEERVTLLGIGNDNDEVTLEFSKITLKLKSTNMNNGVPTATIEVFLPESNDDKVCNGVDYNGKCYTSSFTVKNNEGFKTPKETINVTAIGGNYFCDPDENGETLYCANNVSTIPSIDLQIYYKCELQKGCTNNIELATLLQDEKIKLNRSEITLKLKSTNINNGVPTATIEVFLPESNKPDPEDAFSCRIGCVCNGETITCPNESEPTVTSEIQIIGIGTPASKEEHSKINISMTKINENKTSVKSETGKIEAVTYEKIAVVDSELIMSTKRINILPEEAVTEVIEYAKIESVKEVELKTENETAIYSISGTKKAKLLMVFPFEMEIKTKVNAETGEVISLEKPWWSFLAVEE